MKSFKTFSLAVMMMALAALLLPALSARAQTYGSQQIGSYATNIAVSVTTNQSAVIDMRYNRHVNITLSAGAVTNATTLTANFLRSPDNVTYDNTAYIAPVLSMAANSVGTTNVDYDVGACGYLKLSSLVVGSGGSITNVGTTGGNGGGMVGVSLKPGN